MAQTLSISAERLSDLQQCLTFFNSRKRASVTQIQSLVGSLSFASTVLPGSRPFLRRMIDLSCGPAGRRNLTSDIAYWHHALRDWNGRACWRKHARTPFVFGSDASTSGFAYALESAPPAKLKGLPRGFKVGVMRVGVWSAHNGDAQRQASSAAIQFGEAFCLLAAVVEFGPVLRDSHIVFMCDNEADVHAFNRNSSRDARVCQLLRGVADHARRFNFSFHAVHRRGVDNDAMDWASRPARHQFTSSAAGFIHAPAHDAPLTSRARADLARYPPLTTLRACVCK